MPIQPTGNKQPDPMAALRLALQIKSMQGQKMREAAAAGRHATTSDIAERRLAFDQKKWAGELDQYNQGRQDQLSSASGMTSLSGIEDSVEARKLQSTLEALSQTEQNKFYKYFTDPNYAGVGVTETADGQMGRAFNQRTGKWEFSRVGDSVKDEAEMGAELYSRYIAGEKLDGADYYRAMKWGSDNTKRQKVTATDAYGRSTEQVYEQRPEDFEGGFGQKPVLETKSDPLDVPPAVLNYYGKEHAMSLEQLSAVDLLNQNIKPQFMTIPAAIKGTLASWKARLWDKDFAPDKNTQDREVFMRATNEAFNQYRVDITGAQAAMQELTYLEDAYLNKRLSYWQYKARLKAVKKRLVEINKRAYKVLTERKIPKYNDPDTAVDMDALRKAWEE